MAQQVHARVSQPGSDAATRTADDDDVDQAVADAAERVANETLDTTDALLDEIDAILIEEEEFAVNYVQKGGQ
jgi:ubiquitin-like protein Pup